jgi:hypothetical protein
MAIVTVGIGQGFVVQRTATLNRIRGLLSELGIVLPLKAPYGYFGSAKKKATLVPVVVGIRHAGYVPFARV